MPKRTINYLIHPFRYPEWGELVCAILGGLQFIWALSSFSELQNRATLATTIYLSPEAWTVAGLLLAVGHVMALRFGGTSRGYVARLTAAACSLAFWAHFIISYVLNAMINQLQMPFVVPALAAPLVAGAVLWRLWRRY